MKYLLITKSWQFSFVNELTKETLDKQKKGSVEIVDLENKQFLVEKETWQTIPTKDK